MGTTPPRFQPFSQQSLLRPVMPELDSIRGLAILSVLFYHGLYWGVDASHFAPIARYLLNGLQAGRLGVDLFFVLSGFLITGLLIDSRHRPDYYRRFYIRRALRIFPAYLLTILVLVVLRHTRSDFILLSLAYLSNLTPLFGIPVAYAVLWSLAVEEHFYLLWPVLTRTFGDNGLMITSIVIICLSPVSRLIGYWGSLHSGHSDFHFTEYTWNSVDGLAAGALLAVFLRRMFPSRQQLIFLGSSMCVVAAGIWVVGIPAGILTRQRAAGAALQVVPAHLIFAAMIIFFLIAGTSRWSVVVQNPVLMFFGEISYGLYLYHLLVFEAFDWLAKRYLSEPRATALIIVLIRFVVVMSVSVFVALFSRRQIEDRFLRLKAKLAK
jgi:peptidoglycan/LPS O-acetylase OafA/YrhL